MTTLVSKHTSCQPILTIGTTNKSLFGRPLEAELGGIAQAKSPHRNYGTLMNLRAYLENGIEVTLSERNVETARGSRLLLLERAFIELANRFETAFDHGLGRTML